MTTTATAPAESRIAEQAPPNAGEDIPKSVTTPRSTWPFGGNVVATATKTLPERQRTAIRWFFEYETGRGATMAQSAVAVKKNGSTIYKMCTGTYPAKLDGLVADIEKYRRFVDGNGTIKPTEFVETSVARRIWEFCDLAATYNSAALVYGEPQVGKTEALLAYRRADKGGRRKYIRMPANPSPIMLMQEIAAACRVSPGGSYTRMRAGVLEALDGSVNVLVDEVHQVIITSHRTSRVACLEILREIHDRTHCGLVLCGTNAFRDELESGTFRAVLRQLRLRGVFELQLPAKPPMVDLLRIASAYGLPAPTGDALELVKRIRSEFGLGRFSRFLRVGSKLAGNKKQPYAWSHFVAAHDVIARKSAHDEEE